MIIIIAKKPMCSVFSSATSEKLVLLYPSFLSYLGKDFVKTKRQKIYSRPFNFLGWEILYKISDSVDLDLTIQYIK